MRDANGRSHRPAGMPGAGRFESEADDSDLDVEPTPEAVLPRLLRTDNAQYPLGRGWPRSGPSGRMEWIMETVRRYNYRAYPTRDQRMALSRLFGACRYAWNWYVRQRLTDWNFNRSRPSYAELGAKFNRTKTEKALEWLTKVSAVPLAQSLRQCEKAYSAFFRYVEKHGCHLDHKGRPLGYPRFKSRHCGEQSATFTTSARFHVRHERNARWMFLELPKIGEVKLRWSRDLPSRPSSVTLMRHADGTYEASFVVKTEPKAPPKPRHDACGIDMGLESLASIVYSDGTREKVAPLRALRKAERRLGKLNKELSRRKRGSNNYSKTRATKARLYVRIGAQRRDLAYQLASRVAGENQAVAMETLCVKGLMRTRMGKSVADAAWSMFTDRVDALCAQWGRKAIHIDRWRPSSQVCSQCRRRDGPKPLNVREWKCPRCGAFLDRDWNAALNILDAAGLAESLNARGGDVRRRLAQAGRDAIAHEAGTHRTMMSPLG